MGRRRNFLHRPSGRLGFNRKGISSHPPRCRRATSKSRAGSPAVVFRTETELLYTHDAQDPHAPDLKKIDAILADIRKRLGEPEPEAKPLEPGMKTSLDDLEKNGPPSRKNGDTADVGDDRSAYGNARRGL